MNLSLAFRDKSVVLSDVFELSGGLQLMGCSLRVISLIGYDLKRPLAPSISPRSRASYSRGTRRTL